MRLYVFVVSMLLLGPAPAGAQPTVEILCGRATMTAAAGAIEAESFEYGGAERHLCTYTPSGFVPETPHPLVVALHGGDGNASQMMEDARGIIAAAEAMGAIAIFPNGLPRQSCNAALCLDNNWSAPDNVFFVAELIGRQKDAGQVEEDRVHLVGFSGGASLIYDIAATPGFPHTIHSVATVAGAMGLYSEERPEAGFTVIQVHEGSPPRALLVQGGGDPRLPVLGGLDETGRESHLSFRGKVDYWRLATGTAAVAAQPVDILALDPAAPPDVAASRYDTGDASVIEVLDPGLEHEWPDWNVMAAAVDLFTQ
jgi:poly(3-hydroxybutyrate) depolymerase